MRVGTMDEKVAHFSNSMNKTFKVKQNQCNRPFPSCPLPQFQNKPTCKTIEMKMTFVCMKMDVKVKLIFL